MYVVLDESIKCKNSFDPLVHLGKGESDSSEIMDVHMRLLTILSITIFVRMFFIV